MCSTAQRRAGSWHKMKKEVDAAFADQRAAAGWRSPAQMKHGAVDELFPVVHRPSPISGFESP